MRCRVALAGIDMQTDRPLYISPCSRQGLPPPHVTMRRCGLLHRSFHPYPFTGGIVSVALSLGLPPAAVSGYRILRCPDFPLVPYAGNERSSNQLPFQLYVKYHKSPRHLLDA